MELALNRISRSVLALCFAALLSACTAQKKVVPLPPDSGFLRNYSDLVPSQRYSGVFAYQNANRDVSKYQMIMPEPVQVLAKSPTGALIPQQNQAYAKQLQGEIVTAFGKRYPVVKQSGFGVLRIRSAVIQDSASQPLSVEMEFSDSQNKEVVAAVLVTGESQGRPKISVMLRDALDEARGFHRTSNFTTWESSFK